MALAGRKFRVILIGMVVALLVAGGLAASASAQTGDRDCADFPSQQAAQSFFEANGGPQQDPNRLDADNDGEACETFPYDDETGGNASSSQYDQYNDDDDQQQQVINVPNKPLPNTGGFPPLLAVGFLLVAGAGLGTALLRRSF